jgi:Spy/CpxP family protein refolding chaperone
MLLAPTLNSAQSNRPFPPRGAGAATLDNRSLQGRQALSELKEYLGLSEEQVVKLQELRKGIQAQMQPLRAQLKENRTALKNLMDASNPDQAEVGKLVLENRGIRGKMKAVRDSVRDQVMSVLTNEQKTQIQELQEAMKLARKGRALHWLGLGPEQGKQEEREPLL